MPTVEIDYELDGVTTRLLCVCSALHPAKIHGSPENCCPAGGGDIEDIRLEDGTSVFSRFSEKELASFQETCWEQLADKHDGDYCNEPDRDE